MVEIPHNVIPIETGKVLKSKKYVMENTADEERTRTRRLIECLMIALQIAKEPRPPA